MASLSLLYILYILKEEHFQYKGQRSCKNRKVFFRICKIFHSNCEIFGYVRTCKHRFVFCINISTSLFIFYATIMQICLNLNISLDLMNSCAARKVLFQIWNCNLRNIPEWNIKSSRFGASFKGISWLGPAFIFLWWFKLARIYLVK